MSAHLPPGNWAALAVTLGIVSLLLAGFGGVYPWVWGPLSMVAIAAAVVSMCLQVKAGIAFAWDPIFVPALGFFALVLASWVCGWTVYRAATLTGLLQLGGLGGLLFLAATAFREPANVRRLGIWAWCLGGILGFEAIAQAFTAHAQIYWFHDASYASPVGPFVYHNHFAGFVELLLPLGYVYAFRREGHGPQWQGWLRRGLCPALLIAALVVSASRGGLLIVILELLVIAGWLGVRRHGRRKHIQPIWALAGLGLLAVLLVGWGPMASRLGQFGSNDVSVTARWQVSLTCLKIFTAHPWVGSGFATFPDIYPAFQSFDTGQQFLEAHDDYAQVLAETGLVGASLVAAFLLLFLLRLARLGTRHANYDLRLRRAAALGALALLVHSAFDFQFHAPANAALFFVLVMVSRASIPAPSGGVASAQSQGQQRGQPVNAAAAT